MGEHARTSGGIVKSRYGMHDVDGVQALPSEFLDVRHADRSTGSLDCADRYDRRSVTGGKRRTRRVTASAAGALRVPMTSAYHRFRGVMVERMNAGISHAQDRKQSKGETFREPRVSFSGSCRVSRYGSAR